MSLAHLVKDNIYIYVGVEVRTLDILLIYL